MFVKHLPPARSEWVPQRPNYKNWDKRRTVNSKVLLGLGWATGVNVLQTSVFVIKHVKSQKRNFIIISYGHFNIIAQECKVKVLIQN